FLLRLKKKRAAVMVKGRERDSRNNKRNRNPRHNHLGLPLREPIMPIMHLRNNRIRRNIRVRQTCSQANNDPNRSAAKHEKEQKIARDVGARDHGAVRGQEDGDVGCVPGYGEKYSDELNDEKLDREAVVAVAVHHEVHARGQT
ncbi:MAG: hypothetical protein Q9190_006804, partial [Brigantiaea leucoxantha]